MIRQILDCFISKRCFVCGKELSMKEQDCCCASCKPFVEIVKNNGKRCEKCGRGLSYMYSSAVCPGCNQHTLYFDKAVSAFYYEGHIKDAIHRLKFAKSPYLAAIFAGYMEVLLPPEQTFDYIVYPPVNRRTFYRRGFNQSELMAQELSMRTGIPLLSGALQKEKQNEIQSRLTGKDRFRNVAGAFSVRQKAAAKLSGKRILLIDDVLTIGATASECARMLKRAKASSVFVVTAASIREL